MFLKGSEFTSFTGTCLSQKRLCDQGRGVECKVGGGKKGLFSSGHLQESSQPEPGPWVRALKRGHGIKRVEVHDIGESEREEEPGKPTFIYRTDISEVREVAMALLMNQWIYLVALSLTVTTSHALRR